MNGKREKLFPLISPAFLVSFIFISIACIASVSSRGSSRKLGKEQKKKKMNDVGGGGE